MCETAARGAGKAWRYVAEMDQIALTLQSADLPDGSAKSAAAVYQRLASLKGDQSPSLAQVLDLLVDRGD
jgi:hypothetical protein